MDGGHVDKRRDCRYVCLHSWRVEWSLPRDDDEGVVALGGLGGGKVNAHSDAG